MKRFLAIVLLAFGIIYLSQTDKIDNFLHKNNTADSQSSINTTYPQIIGARGAILIDSNNGTIIYSHNENDMLYPASTTKILTALVALENLDLDENIRVNREILLTSPGSSKAGLKVGQEISLRDLIRALMLPSGNDAAYTIAVHTARQLSQDENLSYKECLELFTDLMNQTAVSAGAKNSHFNNPDGYQDEDHYSTAYDIAMIAKKAMQDTFFSEAAATVDYQLPDSLTGQGGQNSWHNTNQLLDPESPYYYPPATGIKTGHTTAAGHCLVSSAAQGDINLIAVVLGSSENGVWTDSIGLFKNGFSNYQPDTDVPSLSYSPTLRIILAVLLLYVIIRLLASTNPRAKSRKR